jgi:DNA (cytosine-5)-methyltransferase 1
VIGGSLFSGIEGFGLGLLWSGLITEIAFQVEVDPFCRRVLDARFPEVDRSIEDVRAARAISLPAVDLLFGGPPCQDISGAGKGEGLDGERSGLVREMLRLVGELGPGVVLIEIVASGARRWVCPVRGALEALGYRTAALNIGVDDCGGPHRRRRIFILAYAERDAVRFEQGRGGGARREGAPELAERSALADAYRDGQPQRQRDEPGERRRPLDGGEEVAYAQSARREGRLRHGRDDKRGPGPEERRADVGDPSGPRREGPFIQERHASESAWGQGPDEPAPRVGSGVDGLPSLVVRWPAGPGAPQEEWEPPRVLAGVHERAAKLKALGNAVSPVQAYYVGLWAQNVLHLEGLLRRSP